MNNCNLLLNLHAAHRLNTTRIVLGGMSKLIFNSVKHCWLWRNEQKTIEQSERVWRKAHPPYPPSLAHVFDLMNFTREGGWGGGGWEGETYNDQMIRVPKIRQEQSSRAETQRRLTHGPASLRSLCCKGSPCKSTPSGLRSVCRRFSIPLWKCSGGRLPCSTCLRSQLPQSPWMQSCLK
jgi:hypothetical protein